MENWSESINTQSMDFPLSGEGLAPSSRSTRLIRLLAQGDEGE